MAEDEKLAYIYSINVKRRHLSKEWKQQEAIKLRQQGWSQEQIGNALGVPQQTIHDWLGRTEEVITDSGNNSPCEPPNVPATRIDSLGRERPMSYASGLMPAFLT